MSSTLGETGDGYDNSVQQNRDGRLLWKGNCVSFHFSKDGIVEEMQY